jgi:hypothetical protein
MLDNEIKIWNYSSYDEYIETQKQHVNTTARTQRREIDRIADIEHIRKYFPSSTSVLCVGARHESELNTFISRGFDARGFDLYSTSPKIEICDMHDMNKKYEPKSVDIVFMSHSLEHSIKPVEVLHQAAQIATMAVYFVLPVISSPTIKDPSVLPFMRNIDPNVLEQFFIDNKIPLKSLYFDTRNKDTNKEEIIALCAVKNTTTEKDL